MLNDDDLTDAEKRDYYDRGKASMVYENGRLTYRITRTRYPGVKDDFSEGIGRRPTSGIIRY